MSELTNAEIIELAAKTAVSAYKQEQENEKKAIHDKRLRNTKLLLSNYRSFKAHANSAVYTAEQAEDAIEILDMMWDPRNRSQAVAESIKASCAKTTIIVNHIDTMIAAYKLMCYNSHNPLEKRRFDILNDYYLTDIENGKQRLTMDEIALKYNVDTRTAYNDLKQATNRIAKLIFGIDFMVGTGRY